MQIADQFSSGSFPPSMGAGSHDIARQVRQQKVRHRLIWLSRTAGLWWYRILLIVLAICIAIFAGGFGYFDAKIFVGAAICIVLFFMAIRRVEFGIVLAAIVTTPLVPPIGQLKSLQLHTIELLLVLLFITLLVQTAFGAREPILPSI